MTTLEKLEKLIYEGFKETDRKMNKLSQDVWKHIRATTENIKNTDKQLKETDRKLSELITPVNGITDSLGLFAENMVKPAMGRIFAKRGIELKGFLSRASQNLNGRTMEIDIIGYGPKHVVAVEVKMKLKQSDVKNFIKTLNQFFDFFDHFRGLTLYGAVAGMSIDKGVEQFAYKQGLFVLAQSGENIQLLNDEKFVPRAFRYEAK